MSSDDFSGARPAAPIVLRIKLRYGDVDVMVQRFAANVGKSGLFLPTRSLQPLGAEIKFELRLADDTPVLVGLGRVKSVRAPDPQQPRAVFGIGVELMRVTPQSRALILRMLEHRRVSGLPEVGLPTADDIDAARRADGVEPGRDLMSGPTPMLAPVSPAAAMTEVMPGDGLLTSPRRTTGPISVVKLATIAPLSAEPPRRRRAAIDEIIASAAAPLSGARAEPGLDDGPGVDVAAAIARARALAGGALDAELAELSEAVSVPLEISVEAASAELARQLGGRPVRRDRSAGSAAPAIDGAAADGPVHAMPDASGPLAPQLPAAADGGAGTLAPRPPSEPTGVDRAATVAPSGDDEGDGQDDDVAVALAELDSDEHTDLGGSPAPAFELPAEVDAPDPDTGAVPAGGGAADDGDGAGSVDPAGVEVSFEEFDDFEILSEADADDAEVLAVVGALREAPEPGELDAPRGASAPPIQLDFAARLDFEDHRARYHASAPVEEVSDRYVVESLVEELTTRHQARRPTGQRAAVRAPSSAIRRGVHAGDDPFDDDAERPSDTGGAVQPIFEQEQSTSYTLAGLPLDSIDIGADLGGLPPARRGLPRLASVRPEPALLRHPPLTLGAQVDDHELEHALEALDVDLDDLASPHAATQLARDASRPIVPERPEPAGRSAAPSAAAIRPGAATRAPSSSPLRPPAATPGVTRTAVAAPAAARRTRAPRAPSDDGIDIDFDDED